MSNFDWNWTDFCPTGLQPFEPNSNDLLPCFQLICLQIPIYSIFTIISSYYFGAYCHPVHRNVTQRRLLCVRIIISVCLAFLPAWKVLHFHQAGIPLYAPDILVVCVESLMWMIHSGYLLNSRNFGDISHRGPLLMNVVWSTMLVTDVIWLRTTIQFTWWTWSLATFILDCAYLLTLLPQGNAVVQPLRYPPNREQEALLPNRYVYFNFDFNETVLGHAQDEAGLFSRLIFNWVEPLISKGLSGGLKRIEDLFDLPDALNISYLNERLQMRISQSRGLFWALNKAFGKEFYLIGVLRFIADISSFAGPLLLGGLLSEETNQYTGTDITPYFYALGLFGTTLLSAFCSSHFSWRMSMIGMKMRIGVVSAIYRKALEARGLKNSKPEILNLMSTDTDRIVNSCISFHSLWSIPFQLFTTLYLLYTQIGTAFIAGLIFAASLIPINRWLAKKISVYSQGLMSAKDDRLSATSEALSGAKQIKLHAWEDVFIKKIQELRSSEEKYLAKRKYLDALCVYFWATTPVLMCFLTFGVSALLGNPLVASTTYTSVALLNMLIGPLNAFPWVLNGLIEAWISIERVQELLNLPNLDYSSYYNPIMKGFSNSSLNEIDEKPTVLQLKTATFEHEFITTNQEANFAFRLEKVNLDVKKGDLVCVEGPVGGGKSTLISAIVAGINCIDGCVCVRDLNAGFGYVPQTPWLQRGSIRDNIVWGGVFEEQWYRNVLFACALQEDLDVLGGDLMGVGENGRTLSGGQRVRIALARAVYQDKKIYLLDDILASLDSHVAHHIVKHCILGVLREKTRIIVTRSATLFLQANQILHVENGNVTQSERDLDSLDLSIEESSDEVGINLLSRRVSIEVIDEPKNNDNISLDSILLEESREYGQISLSVISCYWKAISTPLSLAVFLFLILMQVSRNISDAWLAYWVTDTTIDMRNLTSHLTNTNRTIPHHSTEYYLGIFAGLTFANSLFTIIRAFLFAYAGIRAAKIIHNQLLNRVMFTQFKFFDITSLGRILNRFSSDTYTIDDSLPFIMNILLAQIVGLIGALGISLYAMPWLGLVVVPMVPVYLNLQHRYRYASRDIKRLSSNALSPLYTHFTETLQGMTTIRSMRASARFQRDFHVKLEESIKAQLTSSAAQQWLMLRLQFLGTFLVGGAGLLAAITSAHASNPGLVGLSISYALSITGLLSGLLNAVAETEQELIAVERVNQYLHLESEKNTDGILDPPFGWPSHGALAFSDVNFSYRENNQLALQNVSFKTEAFERIAIVGRTGAGKSSILAALMRVAPISGGEISLDCVNLKVLPLRVLRDRIGIIPQEPFLFEGTVRENLDPRHRYIDSEIWNAITNCALATMLVQSLGGLDGRLERGGSNLSAGQKQLLCLTRALLKNSKVVCIDEGTSNLDDESEIAMQSALRSCFKSSTILYIAHRLNGLQTMDRILVMDQGKIIETGTPEELSDNQTSAFYSMLQAQRITPSDFCTSDA